MKILIFIFLFFLSFNASVIANEAISVPVNQTKVILNDGSFKDGLPYSFNINEKKVSRWGWGNWRSSYGYANIGFSQLGPGLILTQSGMISKKILKNWGVENFKLGKKKGFKSDNKRALVQLVEIDNLKCVVVISRFGESGRDAHSRYRSSIDGYICKNSGDLSIDDGKNFLHCMELKNQGTHFIGKKIDNKCIKKELVKKEIKKSDNQIKSKYIYCQDSEGVYEYLTGRDTCYDGQKKINKSKYLKLKNKSKNNLNQNSLEERLKKLKSLFDKDLITKEEYDQKRKEILDEM